MKLAGTCTIGNSITNETDKHVAAIEVLNKPSPQLFSCPTTPARARIELEHSFLLILRGGI